MYQLEDAEVTIIGNRHSLAPSSYSPPPFTPAASSLNHRSESELDYRDDPIGNAHLSNRTGQSKGPREQRSTVPGRPENGHSRGPPHFLAPPLPLRTLPKPTPKPRAKSAEQKLPEGRDQSPGSRSHSRLSADAPSLRNREEEEEEEGIKKRVSDYLQAAEEEGEKRQVCYFNSLTAIMTWLHLCFLQTLIKVFTDIDLDMSTQREL